MGACIWELIYGAAINTAQAIVNIWKPLYGSLYMRACIWELLCGSFCVGASIWELLYASLYNALQMRHQCVTNALFNAFPIRNPSGGVDCCLIYRSSHIEAPI